MRVLVVEDMEVMADAIGAGLRREGMAVDVVLDGDNALRHLAVTRYDVVVLDRDGKNAPCLRDLRSRGLVRRLPRPAEPGRGRSS